MNKRFLRRIAILLLVATLSAGPSPLVALAAAVRSASAGPLSEAEIAELLASGGASGVPGVDLEALLTVDTGDDELPGVPGPIAAPEALPERAVHHFGGFLRYYAITSALGPALELGASGTEWQLLPAADGSLEFQARLTAQCLDALPDSPDVSLGLADYQASPGQQWRIYDIGGGDFVIAAQAGSLYLAMDGGEPVAMERPAGEHPDEFRWHITLTYDGTDAPGATFYGLANQIDDTTVHHATIADTATAGSYAVTLAAASDSDAEQRWSFVDAGGGLYSVKSNEGELALTATAAGRVVGTNYKSGADQRWRVLDAGGGWYRLFPASSELPLARVPLAGGGYELCLAASVADDTAQKWAMPLKTASIASDLEEGDTDAPVFLFVKHSGMYAEPEDGSADDHAPVVQAGFDASLSQQWKVTSVGGGYYSIINEDSGLALTAADALTGSELEQGPYSGEDGQKWRFQQVGGTSYYAVLPKAQPADPTDDTRLYLSVEDSSPDDGASLVLAPLARIETETEVEYYDEATKSTKTKTVTVVTFALKDSQKWSFFRSESDKFAFSKYYPDLSVKYALGSYEIGRVYDPTSGRGSMGLGWHLAYQYALVKDYNDDPATKVKIVRLPDGGKYIFEVDGSTFKASDSRSTLTLVGTEFQLATPDQTIYHFDQSTGRMIGFSDRYGNKVSVAYDAQGLVSTIADASGREFVVRYANGLLSEVEEQYAGATVREIRYLYGGSSLTRVEGDANKVVNLRYDYKGLLAEITDDYGDLIDGIDFFRDGKQYGKVMRTRDAMGNVRTYDYSSEENADGTVVSTIRITDALGRVKVNVNDRKTFIRTVTDYEGGTTIAVTETKYTTVTEGGKSKNKYDEPAYEQYNKFKTGYTRDANGNIELTTNPDGSVRTRVYNSKNSLIADVDEVGYGTFNLYAADGVTLLQTFRYLGTVDTGSWSSGGVVNRSTVEAFVATLNEGNSAVVTYTYYAEHLSTLNGLVHTMTDSTGVTTFEYNARGLVSLVTGPSSGTTEYEYDADGLVSRKVSPGGRETLFTYDGNGRLTSETKVGPDGDSVSTRTYDASGRVVRDTNALGNYSEYRYWFGSSAAWVRTTPDGYNYVAEFDVYGNVLAETRPDGFIFAYTYDPVGRRLTSRLSTLWDDASVLLESHSYDDFVAETGYSAQTSTIVFSDGDEMTLSYRFDYGGRELEVTSPQGTQYTTYHANGRVKDVTDVAGRTKTVTYGPLCGADNFVSMTEADGSWSEYSFDAAGRTTALRKYAANDVLLETTEWQHDVAGNILSETKDGVLRSEYSYDADTNLVKEKLYMSDSTWQEVTYEYNYLNKASSMTLWVAPEDVILSTADQTVEVDGMVGLVTTYAYDLEGNLTTETRPDGLAIEYSYDAMNRRCGETRGEYANSVLFNWEGNPLRATDMNGQTIVYEYGPHGEETRAYFLSDGHLAVRATWYDRAGRKIAEVLPENFESGRPLASMNRLVYDYDAAGRLVTQRYVGTGLEFDPDLDEWVESDLDLVVRALGYDEMGNIVKELDADAYIRAPGATVAAKVENGDGPWRRYDVNGNVVAEGNVASVDAGLANGHNRYEYDGLNRKIAEFAGASLTEGGQVSGLLTRYSYDGDGNVTVIEYRSVSLEDDAEGPLPDGQLLSEHAYEYDLAGAVTAFTKPNGAREEHEYNQFGLLRKDLLPGDETIPAAEAHYWYDAVGRVVRKLTAQVGSGEGREELFTYDRFDRLVSETIQESGGARAITNAWAFDGNGNKVAEIDGNRNLKAFTYSEMNKPRTTITRTGEDTWFGTGIRYDRNGNSIESRMIVVNGDRYVERLEVTEYDARSQKIATVDTFGNVVQKINHSPAGRPIQVFDAVNNQTTMRFDADGREIEWIDAEGHTEERVYDLAGRMVEKIDGNGASTWTEYDAFGQIVASYAAIDGVRVQTMAAEYNASANLASRTDGNGLAMEFAYNARDLLVARTDSGGEQERVLAYDVYGNLLQSMDRNGSVITFAYDIQGHKVAQSAGAESITFEYDGNGNVIEVVDQSGRTTSTYDEFNRLLTKEVPSAGTFYYQYELMDGLYETDGAYADIVIDPIGNVTTKVYDQAGRLKTVKDGGPEMYEGTVYEYYPTGMRKSVTYPNGYSESYEYYGDSQLMTLRHLRADASVLDEYAYTYDGAHNQITELRTSTSGPKTTTVRTDYEYDERSQVVAVHYGGDKSVTYAYDLAGNRTEEVLTEPSLLSTTGYEYDQLGRLASTTERSVGTSGGKEHVSVEVSEYAYDRNGNQVEVAVNGKSVEQRQYDAYNQLVETRIQNKAYRYVYSAAGKVVAKEDGGVTTRYVYDGDQVVLELDRGGKQTARNVQGLNVLSREDRQSEFYYLYSGRGDVMSLVSSNGVVVREYVYDAFGKILDSFRERLNPFRHAGALWDFQTGLYMLGSRMYDPNTARFLQEDYYLGDSEDPLSLNLYSYCRNNPVKYVDPSGHFFITLLVLAIVGAVLAVGATLAADLIDDGTINTDWRIYVGAAVGGLLSGACMGAGLAVAAGLGATTAGMVFAGAVAGAVGGFGSTLLQDAIDDGTINTDWRYYLAAGVTGAILGAIGGYSLGQTATAAAKEAAKEAAKATAKEAAKAAIGAAAKRTVWESIKHGLAVAGRALAQGASVAGKEMAKGVAISVAIKLTRDLIISGGIDTDWKAWVHTLVEGAAIGLVRGAGMRAIAKYNPGQTGYIAGGAALSGVASAGARVLSYLATGTEINWTDVALTGGLGAVAGAALGYSAYKAKVIQAQPFKPNPDASGWANFRARADYNMDFQMLNGLIPKMILGVSGVLTGYAVGQIWGRFQQKIWDLGFTGDTMKYALPYVH